MIYAMSDIHGCMDFLKDNMEYVDLSGDNKIVLCGDYIDYGKDSGDVLRYIYNLQKEYGSEKVIVLKGNHEQMLLDWVEDYSGKISISNIPDYSWLRNDSELGYCTFKTLVTKKQFEDLLTVERNASYDLINIKAVKMVKETSGWLISWLKSLPLYYETENQIFVHAGIDEEGEDLWKWRTSEDIFLYKYPATTGKFYKTIIAGHVGTGSIVGDKDFHDIFYDGASHYYIDGSCYKKGGRMNLLAYDEEKEIYYQVKDGKLCKIMEK